MIRARVFLAKLRRGLVPHTDPELPQSSLSKRSDPCRSSDVQCPFTRQIGYMLERYLTILKWLLFFLSLGAISCRAKSICPAGGSAITAHAGAIHKAKAQIRRPSRVGNTICLNFVATTLLSSTLSYISVLHLHVFVRRSFAADLFVAKAMPLFEAVRESRARPKRVLLV